MSGVGYDPTELYWLARNAAAIFLCGWVIKMMDDFLDLRYDVFQGEQTLAVRLGEGTLPYSLLLFCLAMLVQPEVACSLFLGAYAAGMAGDLERQLPSGLYGYQEALLVLVCGFLFLPWHAMLWGAAVMLAVQAVDDLWDLAPDRISGNPNLARRFGIVETRLTGLGALLVAAAIRPLGTAMVFVSIPIVMWAISTMLRPAVRTRGWES